MKNILKASELKLNEVPEETVAIKKIDEFALTFDWNEQNNKLQDLSLESNFEVLDIVSLRSILYTEQRRWNHFGEDYDFHTEKRIRELIKIIREKLVCSAPSIDLDKK